MKRWIINTNIQDFRRKLAEETGTEKRRVLLELLRQEEQKLRDIEKSEDDPDPPAKPTPK